MDFGFHDIELLKDQPLGTGSYGAVCKARCDELVCAAKIVHPSLYVMDGPDAVAKNVPLEKFRQECRLLCAVKHPNIVQYLGTWREPGSGRSLVLLMELCDRSLTRYLEEGPDTPVPYHIQVNIIHDVSLALIYLHKNNLIHRDLSSNNVLLMRDLRAKITDFGMTKFMHHRLTPLTLCPGTQAYMPPEALNQTPSYTHKLDCFSLGVLAIQIVTRKFPTPTERFESIPSPQSPAGFVLQPVSEEKRRSSHISMIEESHPFLPLIGQCLSYKEQDRPLALGICRRMAKLKDSELYKKGIELPPICSTSSVTQLNGKDQPTKTNQDLTNINDDPLQNKLYEMERKLKETEKLLQESRDATAKELKQKEVEMKVVREKFVAIQRELESLALPQEPGKGEVASTEEKSEQAIVVSSSASKQDSTLSLDWQTVGVAPQEFTRGAAVVLGDLVYCHSSGKNFVSEFDISSGSWSNLPRCRCSHFSLACVGGRLTAIGGYDFTTTNKLFTYCTDGPGKGSWVQELKPMPTARCNTVSVSTDTTLVVAGGDESGYNDYLSVVEAMDIASGRWSGVARLPQPCLNLSATLFGDQLYVTGGIAPRGNSGTYSCSLSNLLSPPARGKRLRALTQPRKTVWQEIGSPPTSKTTLVTLCGEILAIGGLNEQRKPVTGVYRYDVETGGWHKLSDLILPRSRCIAAVFEGGIICIGGQGENTIEIASPA